jgi:hypothetical protein
MEEPYVQVGSASLRVHQTVRIPDDAKRYFIAAGWCYYAMGLFLSLAGLWDLSAAAHK